METPNAPLSPQAAIQGACDRLDFAANALRGMPVDFWSEKLGSDPSKWADEALSIRAQYEKTMQSLGVGTNLPRAPIAQIVGAPNGGMSAPLAEFYQKLNPQNLNQP